RASLAQPAQTARAQRLRERRRRCSHAQRVRTALEQDRRAPRLAPHTRRPGRRSTVSRLTAGSNNVWVVKCRSPHLPYLNAALVVLLVTAGGASAAPARTSQPGQAASCSRQLRHCSRASDKQAPSAPRRLSASAVDISRITLSWRASTDKIGVAGYRVFRD